MLDSSAVSSPENSVFMQISLKYGRDVVDSQIVGAKMVNDGMEEWITGGGMLGVSTGDAEDPLRKLDWQLEFPHSALELDEISVKVNKINVEQIKTALEAMARMPTGCFEQTASSVAPQIGAYQVMKQILVMEGSDDQNGILEEYVKNIRAGYKRMTTFECEEGGYEWFGQGPGHETLTAYGLGLFNDIKNVADDIVDEDTIARNAAWLQTR